MLNDDDHLYHLVFNQMWNDAIVRASAHPEEAKYTNEEGETALHVACWQSAPVEVLRAIVGANPASTILLNNIGWTPLHFACIHSSPAVVKQLLEVNVSSVTMRDQDNCTAFVTLLNDKAAAVNKALASPVEVDKVPNNMLDFWEKACLFIRLLYHGSMEDPLPDGKKFLVVHACAGIVDLPLPMLKLAIKFNSEQLREEDEGGNFPLHIAAKTIRRVNSTSSDVVDCLVEVYPGAARRFNNDRRLPLHLAIESFWGFRGGAVESILNAFPGALTARDRTSGLFPFMHAAFGLNADLTKTFCLLLKCPELERFANWRTDEKERQDVYNERNIKSTHCVAKHKRRSEDEGECGKRARLTMGSI